VYITLAPWNNVLEKKTYRKVKALISYIDIEAFNLHVFRWTPMQYLDLKESNMQGYRFFCTFKKVYRKARFYDISLFIGVRSDPLKMILSPLLYRSVQTSTHILYVPKVIPNRELNFIYNISIKIETGLESAYDKP
jgi:hypothetical protein